MSGISLVLNIARGAMMAQQKAIDVTSHNIANVNTPGYTRQRLILETQDMATLGRLKLGLGVKADEVIQYFDRFTTKSIQEKRSLLSELESEQSILSYLEGIFNETSGNGLAGTLEAFWSAWQDLANNPSGLAERTVILQRASTLTDRFRALYNDLTRTREEMNNNLDGSISSLNTLTKQIANLNERIVSYESSGTSANDLRDKRNQLIEEVSKLTEITSLEEKNGAVTIMTRSGLSLVDGTMSWGLQRDGDALYWNGIPSDISQRLSGGSIGAWLDLRDEIIPQYMANMDEIAASLINQVNQLHYTGYGLDGLSSRTFFAPFNMDPLQVGTWGGSSSVNSGGIYAGQAEKTFQFQVTSGGNIGTDNITLHWDDGAGHSGDLVFDPTYLPGTQVDVFEGIRISLTNGSVTAGDTFSVAVHDARNAAGQISLSPDVDGNPGAIAAASAPHEPGNNEMALAIQAIQDQGFTIPKWVYQRGKPPVSQTITGTLDDAYHVLIGDLGMLNQKTVEDQDFQQTLINQLSEVRDSVSGVNLDEEMTQLIQYQHAFAAASKLVSAVDEMLQNLLEMR